MSWGKTKPRMPSTKGVREWLPAGLSGGGSSGGGAPSQQVSVMSRMTNVMQPASEGGRNMANMAGLPVAPANDSAFSGCCPKLTFRERVYGCIGCFLIGIVISMLSFVSWFAGHTATWAILYTLGNIISLCGSGFLLGPRRQLDGALAVALCAPLPWSRRRAGPPLPALRDPFFPRPSAGTVAGGPGAGAVGVGGAAALARGAGACGGAGCALPCGPDARQA